MSLPPSGNTSPLSAAPAAGSEPHTADAPQTAGGRANLAPDARWASFWKRITMTGSLTILAAVALFMLPKIDGRNSRLQVQADTRTELWRQELIASGQASPQATPAAPADVWLLAGMILGAGLLLGGLAYVAIGPRRKAQQNTQENAPLGSTVPRANESPVALRQFPS